MARVLQCPHFYTIGGLTRGCMAGHFPCDCERCCHPDKHYVDVTTSTSTTWVDNKSVKSE